MSRSILDAVSDDLAPLARAAAIQEAAARVGFDWPDTSGMISKIEEETHELRAACGRAKKDEMSEEIGDLLLVLVNIARAEGLDLEACLREACSKFERRFRSLEADLASQGKQFSAQSPGALEALWKKAKEKRRNT
jgi:ATP diphosphatase